MPENNDILTETETEVEVTETDIFQQQKRTIDTLINVLERQKEPETQPVFVTQTAPAKKPTNYVLYIGLALAAFIFLRK